MGKVKKIAKQKHNSCPAQVSEPLTFPRVGQFFMKGGQNG
jgi:hypothetical protein